MNTDRLAQFANQKYLCIETYRKRRRAGGYSRVVREDNGIFYIYSLGDAGKVKRIRNNPRVRIVPCDYGGKPTECG